MAALSCFVAEDFVEHTRAYFILYLILIRSFYIEISSILFLKWNSQMGHRKIASKPPSKLDIVFGFGRGGTVVLYFVCLVFVLFMKEHL